MGRRGAVLIVLGLVDFVYGWVRLIHPGPGSPAPPDSLAQLLPFLPPTEAVVAWGLAWWVTGVFCVVNAFRLSDRWGFGMAMGIKVTWSAANLVAWIEGVPNSAAATTVWVLAAWMVFVIAGWPEYPPLDEVMAPPPEDGSDDG